MILVYKTLTLNSHKGTLATFMRLAVAIFTIQREIEQGTRLVHCSELFGHVTKLLRAHGRERIIDVAEFMFISLDKKVRIRTKEFGVREASTSNGWPEAGA